MTKNLCSSCIFSRFLLRTNTYLAKSFSKYFAQALFFTAVNSAVVDGSIHLYSVPPNGTVIGGRTKLWSSINEFPLYPFANLGVHYVFGAVNECITMASSTMISNQNLNRFIRLTRPDGSLVAAYTPSGITSDQIQ